MFDFPLAFHLLSRYFSLKKGSLRYPTPRRVLNLFTTIPFLLGLIAVNRAFMFLDTLLFTGFRKTPLNKVVFITGVPRSATTYLFSTLAGDTRCFTAFRLWELIFAPSITQKHLCRVISRMNRRVGRPLDSLISLWDKVFLGRIARLHKTGLNEPEEDEFLLLYAFSSTFLAVLFPEVPAAERFLFFDEELELDHRKRIMDFYKGCVQRHIFFHDPRQQRIFLSKNPGFVSKTLSLHSTFPNARLIYMLRSPHYTIPSTINLNKNLYSLFYGPLKTNPLAQKAKDTVIRWYAMADRSITTVWKDSCVVVPFQQISCDAPNTLETVYKFLTLPSPARPASEAADEHKTHKPEYQVDEHDEAIQEQLGFILRGPFAGKI